MCRESAIPSTGEFHVAGPGGRPSCQRTKAPGRLGSGGPGAGRQVRARHPRGGEPRGHPSDGVCVRDRSAQGSPGGSGRDGCRARCPQGDGTPGICAIFSVSEDTSRDPGVKRDAPRRPAAARPARQPVTAECRPRRSRSELASHAVPRGPLAVRRLAAPAALLRAGCRLALRGCRRVAAFLTAPSGLQHPATRIAYSAEVCGTPAERQSLHLLGQCSTPRAHGLGGSSRICTPGGGWKRNSEAGGWRFVSTWLNETRVTLPTRSKTAVSRISPEAGSARSCSRS